MTDTPASETARMLAEAHAARAAAAGPRAEPQAVAARALWAHASREPGAPVDFTVARALRADPATAERYRTLLSGVAMAHAPFAIAASDGAIRERRVGPFTLSLTEAEDGAPPLLVIRCPEGRKPSAIELVRDGEAIRLALPAPVDEAIVLALDPAAQEAAGAAAALGDPATEIYLI